MDNGLRDLYDTFLDTEELKSILPEATGIWEKDKVLFSNIYSIIHDVNLPYTGKITNEDDEEYDGYWDASYREFLGEQ